MHKIKKAVGITFILTLLIIFSVIIGGIIGNELTHKVTSEYQATPISYSQIEISEPHFLAEKQYTLGGVEGSDIKVINYIHLNENKVQVSTQNLYKAPVTEYILKGTLNNEELKSTLQKKLEIIAVQLKKEETDKYENLIVEKLNYINENSISIQSMLIDLGTIDIFMENCNFYNSLEVKYNINLKDYILDGLSEFESNLCSKYVAPDAPFPTSCTDCFLYPVDKKHPLNNDYAIEVVSTDAIPGGQRFSKIAYSNLVDLYYAAISAGHSMRLTSAYRSYQEQQEVYEGWVQYEMGFGKSRGQAESDANSYSALPGFSEHQLGTTADISSLDCIGIETVCASNERFWNWLRDHAHEFGFVMSYPPRGESKTGYIHEPWHYRFIGVELAKEYKEKYEGKSYPAEFLRNKKLY